jgi:hypothetical protein
MRIRFSAGHIAASSVGVALGLTGGLWIADLGIADLDLKFVKEVAIPAIATLFAAYAGAGYAFKLEQARERTKQLDARRVAGNVAIWRLTLMLNKLVNYSTYFIQPCIEKRLPPFTIEPCLPLADDSIRIDMTSIAFLLEAKEPNILGELSVAEMRYLSTVALIDERSKFFIAEVQPKMQAAEILSGSNVSYGEVANALGPHLFAIAGRLSDDVVTTVTKCISDLKDACKMLELAVRSCVGPGRVISLMADPPPTKENS